MDADETSTKTIERVVTALAAAYNNAHRQRFYTSEEMAAHRAGVRDVAVRLSLYGALNDALKGGD